MSVPHPIRCRGVALAEGEEEGKCCHHKHAGTHHHADPVILQQLVADGEHCTAQNTADDAGVGLHVK